MTNKVLGSAPEKQTPGADIYIDIGVFKVRVPLQRLPYYAPEHRSCHPSR